MDLTFKLHSQQLIRTLVLLGARSEWTQLHDKCQQIWLKSNLAHTRNVLWDIDHSHWTHLYHRSNYFPGPQTRPSSQIVDATVYCLILGFVPAPEPILFEYSIFPCFILRPKFIQNGFIISLGLTCCKWKMRVDFLCKCEQDKVPKRFDICSSGQSKNKCAGKWLESHRQLRNK